MALCLMRIWMVYVDIILKENILGENVRVVYCGIMLNGNMWMVYSGIMLRENTKGIFGHFTQGEYRWSIEYSGILLEEKLMVGLL